MPSFPSMNAAAGAPAKTPTTVQAPSDLAREKGVVPEGNWIGKTQSPTTVCLPTDLMISMAKVKDGQGNINIPLPTDVAKNMSAPKVPGKSVVS